jgi:hypothetical protein
VRGITETVRHLSARYLQGTKKKAGKWPLVVALVVFGVLTVTSIVKLPPVETTRWAPVLLAGAVLLSAVNVFVRGAEYTLSGRLVDHRVHYMSATRVAVLSSAANILPIPGSTLVKVQALKRAGIGYGRGVTVTLAISLVWVGTSGVVTGVLVAAMDSVAFGAILSVGSLVLLLAAIVLLRTTEIAMSVGEAFLRMFLLEMFGVVTSSARLVCITSALGFGSSWAAGAVLSTAGVVATAAGIFPGGLGLRELISAAVAPVVGLTRATGAVVSAIDRVINLAVLGVATAIVLAYQRRHPEPVPDAEAATP